MVVGSHMLVALSVPVGVTLIGAWSVDVGIELPIDVEASEVGARVAMLETLLSVVAVAMLLVNVADPTLEAPESVAITEAVSVGELVMALPVALSVPLVTPLVGVMLTDPLSEETVADPEIVAESLAKVEVGTTSESVPPTVVLLTIPLDPESVGVGVTDPAPLVMTLVTLPESLVADGATDPASLVVVGTTDPESLVATTAVELGESEADMLEMILARSVVGVGVDDATSEETGVIMAPVEAADDEGIIPERMLENRFGSVVLEAGSDEATVLETSTETGVLEAGSDDTTVLEGSTETGVLDTGSAVVVGTGATVEDAIALETSEIAELSSDGSTAAAVELETSVVVGAVDPAAELPDALPEKEIPEETAEVVVGSTVVLEEVTTPPGPKVIAVPEAEAVVSGVALLEAVGNTITAGTDPVDAIGESEETVGEITTSGLDPVDAAELSVLVVGSTPTIVVC